MEPSSTSSEAETNRQRRNMRCGRNAVGCGEQTSSGDGMTTGGGSSAGTVGVASSPLRRRAETTMRVMTGC